MTIEYNPKNPIATWQVPTSPEVHELPGHATLSMLDSHTNEYVHMYRDKDGHVVVRSAEKEKT